MEDQVAAEKDSLGLWRRFRDLIEVIRIDEHLHKSFLANPQRILNLSRTDITISADPDEEGRLSQLLRRMDARQRKAVLDTLTSL
jgi:hypothetical protein